MSQPPAASVPGPDRVRAFVAVELPPGHLDALAAYLAALAPLEPAWRPVAPASLHLTLQFLGGVERARLPALEAALGRIAVPSFWLRVGEPGSFGGGRRARVAWLGVTGNTRSLAALAGAVGEACAGAGLAVEDRPYRPHLTLARARDRRGTAPPALPSPPELAPFAVTGFTLFESRLGREGPTYLALGRFPPGR